MSRTERALRTLQSRARQPADPEDPPSMGGKIPDDLATEEVIWLSYGRSESEAKKAALATLADDMRFEYLDRSDLEKAVWRFFCESFLDRSSDKVGPFVAQHARPVVQATCYLEVEYLRVTEERTVGEVRLLPTSALEVPPASGRFSLQPPVGGIAAVVVSGTSYARMAERARSAAEHALRLLRIALREHFAIHNRQLRFRLGDAYAFNQDQSGWRTGPDRAWDLDIGQQLDELISAQRVSRLPPTPGNQFERHADLAAGWIEPGMLASDPIVALLFYFFALEALVGDKGEGQKAPVIAFRTAMLSVALGEPFSHPTETFFLYDTVRSAAVHGSAAPEMSPDSVHAFGSVVRRALERYLQLGEARGFTKQSQLVAALDAHPQHAALVEWLRNYGGEIWHEYFAGLPGDGSSDSTSGSREAGAADDGAE